MPQLFTFLAECSDSFLFLQPLYPDCTMAASTRTQWHDFGWLVIQHQRAVRPTIAAELNFSLADCSNTQTVEEGQDPPLQWCAQTVRQAGICNIVIQKDPPLQAGLDC